MVHDIKYTWFEEQDYACIQIDFTSWILHFADVDDLMNEQLRLFNNDMYAFKDSLQKSDLIYAISENTYNFNEIFKETVDYIVLLNKDKVATHIICKTTDGGIDARVGYGKPIAYKFKEGVEFETTMMNQIHFYCQVCGEEFWVTPYGYTVPENDNQEFKCCGERLTPIFEE